MKYLRQRYIVLLTLLPLFTALALILTLFFSAKIVLAFQLHWLFALGIVLLIISRWGDLKIPENLHEKKTFSWSAWVMRISFIQICLYAVFWGLILVSTQLLPSQLSRPQHPPLFFSTLNLFNFHLALFPWPMVAWFACAFAYTAYTQDKDAYISTLAKPIFGSQSERILGNIIDYDTRFAVGGVLATSLTFAILLTAYLFSQLTTPLSMKLSVGMLMSLLILMMITFIKPFHQLLKLIFSRKLHFGFSLTIAVLVLGGLLAFLNNVFSALHHPIAHPPP